MVICPKCGRYQEDTRTLRKVGVAAKKVAATAGEVTLKFGAKSLASYVGLDGDFAQFSAGRVGSEAAKQIGLNSDNISDKVVFKCDFCKHYWEEMNSPEEFNEIQIKTVNELKDKKCCEDIGTFILSLILLLVSSFFIWLSFDIWSGRIATEVSHTLLGFTKTTTEYSWHYYVFWPLIIFSSIFALVGLFLSIGNYGEYKELKKMSYIDYAKLYMNLVVGKYDK